MKKKLMIAALVVGIAAAFFPVHAVNVIFDRCVNPDEAATAFQNKTFFAFQYYAVDGGSATISVTNNAQVFGSPLDETALETALAAELRSEGFIVIDGNISLIDLAKLKKSPFIDDVVIYFPLLDGGDRDILGDSSMHFFDQHPEARYWE